MRLEKAEKDDVIYCDSPYIGRYVDYYGGWTEESERRLFDLLSMTPARFILSTWHHNDFRRNPFIDSLWSKFHLVTWDHFCHSGGKIENRKSIVEALAFNFEANVGQHNHGQRPKSEQWLLYENGAESITQQ